MPKVDPAVTVERVRFLTNSRISGDVRYAEGADYPLTVATRHEAVAGTAEIIEVTLDGQAHAAHLVELAAAEALWAKENEGTIRADPDLRDEPNPAAAALAMVRSAEPAERREKGRT